MIKMPLYDQNKLFMTLYWYNQPSHPLWQSSSFRSLLGAKKEALNISNCLASMWHCFLDFAAFLEFLWYMQYEICIRPISSAKKDYRLIDGIFFLKSMSKVFLWFWRPQMHYYIH